MGLVRADDDVVLGIGEFFDGVDGVVEEVLADVEFVVFVTHCFFVFGGLLLYYFGDVGGCVGHAYDGLGGAVDAGLDCGLLVMEWRDF